MALLFPVLLGIGLVGSAVVAIPNLVVELARKNTPEVVFRGDTPERLVALTIDDGPSSATPEILEVLAAHGVRATFFVIGAHVREHPEVATRLLEEGHELGHHMMHDEPSIDLAEEAFLEDFREMDGILRGLGGSEIFRPGAGWFDQRMVETAARLGYRTVLGSVYPFDAQLPFSGFSRWFIRQNVSPGAILVLHDGPERGARTADALRSILPELRLRGFEIVPVSELLDRSAVEPE